MAFGAKGNFEKGDFNIDDALGAQQSTQVETPKQETAQPNEVVETKEEPKQPIAEQPKTEYSEIVDTKTQTVETKEELKKEEVKEELTDDAILSFINKKNNTEFKSLDEYQASLTKEVEKEVVKEVDPYADLLDDADREYLEFKKQTKGSYQDYLKTKKNWDEVSDSDLARDRVRQETGLELTNEQADEYIASELGIDLEELEGVDKIKFQAYASKHRKTLKEEQKKYSVPKVDKPKAEQPQEEIVTLDDGRQFTKTEYDRLVNERNQFLANTKKAVDSITDFSFKLTVSENGESRDLNFKYDVTPEDKHSMLSASEQGLNQFIDKEFTNKDGEFMFKDLQEALFFTKKSNREKVFKAIAEKARAEAIEEVLKEGNNVNFERKKLDTRKESDKGYGDVFGKTKAGYGVIGSI